MLILTFHKVLPAKQASWFKREFYTVTEEELAKILDDLLAGPHTPVSPEDVLAGRIDNTSVLLTFDDGTAGHFDIAMPLLKARHLHALFFVSTSLIGTPGYLTCNQICQMTAEGHTIGSHSHDHDDLRMDLLSPDEMRHQLAHSSQILTSITGQPPLFFASPGGFTTPEVTSLAARIGYRFVRTIKAGTNAPLTPFSLESILISRIFHPARIGKMLSSIDSSPVNHLYRSKEWLKRLLPLKAYSILRDFLGYFWLLQSMDFFEMLSGNDRKRQKKAEKATTAKKAAPAYSTK